MADMWIRRAVLGAIVAALTACSGGSEPEAPAELELTTVYLVRHAEKVLDVSNPPLTEAGQVRATALAERLKEAGLTGIHSSDYLRTRQTAAPAAEQFGLDIGIYDPRDLEGIAIRLIAEGGRHLVVGHSNTTQELAEALSGGPLLDDPINEASEYDRLYVVEIEPGGDLSVSKESYGEPYVPQ